MHLSYQLICRPAAHAQSQSDTVQFTYTQPIIAVMDGHQAEIANFELHVRVSKLMAGHEADYCQPWITPTQIVFHVYHTIIYSYWTSLRTNVLPGTHWANLNILKKVKLDQQTGSTRNQHYKICSAMVKSSTVSVFREWRQRASFATFLHFLHLACLVLDMSCDILTVLNQYSGVDSLSKIQRE